jgi:membrane-associated phospholipid phosphatase
LMTKLVGKGSRRGRTWFDQLGDTAQQPQVWAGIALATATLGRTGRRAALRGSVCYLAASAAQIVIKPIIGRSRPVGAGILRLGPVTSSFPSGHAAADLAFNFGASQELPIVFVPLSLATLAAHWSLVRSRGHYVTDVLAGGGLGIAVALATWRLWPPRREDEEEENAMPPVSGALNSA